MLFDLGPGTLRQLAKIGITHDKILHIFISHFHPDHTADLIQFLFVTRYFPGLQKREPFTLTAPLGFKDFLKNIQTTYGEWLNVSNQMMKIEELDVHQPEERSYGHFQMTSHPIKHTPHSLAYRIENSKGKSFVYSGDTEYCEEIIELADGCDVLLLECASTEKKPLKGHLTPSQAGRIAQLSKTKKLILIHFYPEIMQSNFVEDCRKTYSGELIIGRDLLHISI